MCEQQMVGFPWNMGSQAKLGLGSTWNRFQEELSNDRCKE